MSKLGEGRWSQEITGAEDYGVSQVNGEHIYDVSQVGPAGKENSSTKE